MVENPQKWGPASLCHWCDLQFTEGQAGPLLRQVPWVSTPLAQVSGEQHTLLSTGGVASDGKSSSFPSIKTELLSPLHQRGHISPGGSYEWRRKKLNTATVSKSIVSMCTHVSGLNFQGKIFCFKFLIQFFIYLYLEKNDDHIPGYILHIDIGIAF